MTGSVVVLFACAGPSSTGSPCGGGCYSGSPHGIVGEVAPYAALRVGGHFTAVLANGEPLFVPGEDYSFEATDDSIRVTATRPVGSRHDAGRTTDASGDAPSEASADGALDDVDSGFDGSLADSDGSASDGSSDAGATDAELDAPADADSGPPPYVQSLPATVALVRWTQPAAALKNVPYDISFEVVLCPRRAAGFQFDAAGNLVHCVGDDGAILRLEHRTLPGTYEWTPKPSSGLAVEDEARAANSDREYAVHIDSEGLKAEFTRTWSASAGAPGHPDCY